MIHRERDHRSREKEVAANVVDTIFSQWQFGGLCRVSSFSFWYMPASQISIYFSINNINNVIFIIIFLIKFWAVVMNKEGGVIFDGPDRVQSSSHSPFSTLYHIYLRKEKRQVMRN